MRLSRRQRRFLESWWLVLLVPLGLLGWAAFFYIGLRAQTRRWLVYAVVYFAGFMVVVALWDTFDATDLDNHRDDWSTGLLMVIWFVSAWHGWHVRPAFLDRIEELRDAPPDRAFERRVAAQEARHHPKLAQTVGIGRPDRPGAVDAYLVDVNGAPADVLARLPGLDDALARQVVETRPYTSVDELGSVFDLSPLVVEELRDRTVFIEP
jgi:SARP family transcriptional regulator, regulator of embCAB operon